jgi:hypothetical protein
MGGTNGFVNGHLLFNVCYGISQPPHGNDRWVLSGELPVATSKGHETKELAKERAERILEAFVRKLGASFPVEDREAGEKAPVAAETHTDEYIGWLVGFEAEHGPIDAMGASARAAAVAAAFEAGFALATEAAREMLDIQLEDDQ